MYAKKLGWKALERPSTPPRTKEDDAGYFISCTCLMPLSRSRLLDLYSQKGTIVYMVLTTLERQELYAPYLEILRDCRIQSETTQTDLAKATGLSSKYVTLIEGARRVPTVESLLALMAKAGVMRSTGEQLVQELMERFEWKE